MENLWKKLVRYLPLSLKGWLVYAVCMLSASALCVMLQQISTSDVHVPIIFVLVVLIVSLLTDGYFYGILAALTSVIGVNYAFTEPYMQLDFSPYGYPLTFMTMLAVGVAVSALMARAKKNEQIRLESEKEKMRADLLRGMSHDLRTPLTGISGSISAVLENDLDPAQRRELLESARSDADWLCRMVENLLSVTRITDDSAGMLHTQPEVVEEVVGSAVLAFQKRCPEIGIDVSVPEKVLIARMDPVLIQQVLQNLLDNAVLHGGGTTQIWVSIREEEGEACIEVRDNGCGIEKKKMEHLFDGAAGEEMFSDKRRSMGVGLMVCRTIVRAHGGRIIARNRKEGGAEFMFTLPLEEAADDDT